MRQLGEKGQAQTADVLVAVLKSPADLDRLLTEKWYRIPAAFTPTRPFAFIAFYQPAAFGAAGKRIRYYAEVVSRETVKRVDLLPHEPRHPRAADEYVRFRFDTISELARPIQNLIPRRVTFGFTTLERLRSSENLLELYGVPATEQIIADGLRQLGIPVVTQLPIGYSSGRFRLDLAIACRNGWLAIECDNDRAHRPPQQRIKDEHKDAVLRYHDWRIIRLGEADILYNLDRSLARLQVAIASLGGLAKSEN